MLYSKACPRCRGDIQLDRDNFGVFAKCLQCGFNRDFPDRQRTAVPPTETGAVAVEVAGPAGAEERRAA